MLITVEPLQYCPLISGAALTGLPPIVSGAKSISQKRQSTDNELRPPEHEARTVIGPVMWAGL